MRVYKKILVCFLVFSLLLVGVFIGTTGALAQERVILKEMDRAAAEPWKSAMDAVIKAFEAKYPYIKVERTILPPSPSEAELLMKTALASSEPPDVMDCMGRAYVQSMEKAGLLKDLSLAVKDWGEDRFAPGTLTQAILNGKIWAVPITTQDKYLGYNKTIFDKYGLTFSDDWTWQDFLSICEKLKAQGIIPIAEGAMGSDRWASLNWINLLNQQLVGLEQLNSDENVTTGTWTDPGYMEAAEIMKSLIDKDFFGGNPIAINHPIAQARFYTGKAAMMYLGAWDIAGMFAEVGGIAPPGFVNDVEIFEDFPYDPSWKGERRAHQNYAILHGIPEKARHPDEALLFLEFWSDPGDGGGAQMWTRMTQDMAGAKIPPDCLKIPQMKRFAELNAKSSGTFLFLDQGCVAEVWENYSRNLESFLGGEISASEMMKRVQEIATKMRQEFAE